MSWASMSDARSKKAQEDWENDPTAREFRGPQDRKPKFVGHPFKLWQRAMHGELSVKMLIRICCVLLFISTAVAGNMSLEWNLYTGVADGLNMYRSLDVLPRVWTKSNVILIPVTDTTFTDTAPPGDYCWQLKVVESGAESQGSNINCDTIRILEASGLRSP